MPVLEALGIRHPIIQAPMAGVSTPQLASAVSNAGGLGSIGIGATDVEGAEAMIQAVRAGTDRAFNVNLFVHTAPRVDPVRETAWIDALTPEFQRVSAAPPRALRTIYTSFADDDEMLSMLVRVRPPVVSFHFGLPDPDKINHLKSTGCVLLATATNLDEALAAEAAGIDAIIAQGIEAGGHRGVFDPSVPDRELGTIALTRLLVERMKVPIFSAGGIMDGRGIASVLALGAKAAQLGTAFIACPETSADDAYRAALLSDAAYQTQMTRAISGRPARCLANRFTAWAAKNTDFTPPDYPIGYDAGKALNAAAKSVGEYGYGAQWAGQGAPLARAMSAADLMATLVAETRASV